MYRYAKKCMGGSCRHLIHVDRQNDQGQGQLLNLSSALQHLSDHRLYLPVFKSTEEC